VLPKSNGETTITRKQIGSGRSKVIAPRWTSRFMELETTSASAERQQHGARVTVGRGQKRFHSLSAARYDNEADFCAIIAPPLGRRVIPSDRAAAPGAHQSDGRRASKGGQRFDTDSLEYRVDL